MRLANVAEITRPGPRPAPAWPVHTPLLLLVLVVLAPVGLLVMNSLKADVEIKAGPLSLPRHLLFGNYAEAWRVAEYGRPFLNSFLICGVTIIGICLLSGLAAYALTRQRPPGADAVASYYLLAITIPAPLFLVPLFFLWARLGLINTLPGLMLVYLAIYQPFSIFMLRSYFLSLPRELEDAARVDGCSELQVFTRIVMPLAKPAFLTLAVIIGTMTWREFLFAVTLIQKYEAMTVALRYARFSGQTNVDYALQSAAGVMVVLPIVVLFLLLQRRFIQGVVSGALK
jgi:raffinose/stachyose/melibiose transport system permease protein